MSTLGSAPEEGRIFRFDGSSGEIHGPAGTARLAPQPASLLTLLMERSGQVVGRAEIKEELWPAGGVDVDQGIAFALREVRKGLEEAGCDPGIVETIPRRGYRISGETSSDRTRESPYEETAPEPSEPPSAHAAGRSGTSPEDADYPAVWRRSRTIASVAVVVILAALTSTFLPWASDEPVIAVLEHESGDAALAGLAAELGTTLTAVLTDSLAGVAGIVGPTGTASLDGANDVEGAHEDLNACLLASGIVSAIGSDSVRVFTQMVRTDDRVHAWASVDTVAVEDAVTHLATSVLEGARAALAGCRVVR